MTIPLFSLSGYHTGGTLSIAVLTAIPDGNFLVSHSLTLWRTMGEEAPQLIGTSAVQKSAWQKVVIQLPGARGPDVTHSFRFVDNYFANQNLGG